MLWSPYFVANSKAFWVCIIELILSCVWKEVIPILKWILIFFFSSEISFNCFFQILIASFSFPSFKLEIARLLKTPWRFGFKFKAISYSSFACWYSSKLNNASANIVWYGDWSILELFLILGCFSLMLQFDTPNRK